ncbi:MAG: hypothetical protein SGARI_007518, partial [Bacillariaceae sp.]
MNNTLNDSSNSVNKGDHSVSSHSYDDSGGAPFFADMTLDLALAHDIAETPDPTQKSVIGVERMAPSLETGKLEFPTLPALPETKSNTSTNVEPSLSLDRTTSYEDPSHQEPPPQQQEQFQSPSSSFNPQDGSEDLENRDMERVTNDPRNMRRRFQGLGNRLKSNRRSWPKDVSWAMAFCIVVPFSLLFPIWFAKVPEDDNAKHMSSSKWLATAASP